jgi:hypothetical protein
MRFELMGLLRSHGLANRSFNHSGNPPRAHHCIKIDLYNLLKITDYVELKDLVYTENMGEINSTPEHLQQESRLKMNQARQLFLNMGVGIEDNGLVTSRLKKEQLATLKQWQEESSADDIQMPTLDTLFSKTLLSVSLWKQKEREKVNYLLGKGAGVEIAIQGAVHGRAKSDYKFSYRTHSDFELYNVDYPRDPRRPEACTGKIPYTDEYLEVFGGEEVYPPEMTKGLTNIPAGLLTNTAEVVDLGGLDVLVPQLELLFLDKLERFENTPRPEGTDAEILARVYRLNRDLVHDYLNQFVITPRVQGLLSETEQDVMQQLLAIKRNIERYSGDISKRGGLPTTEDIIARVNQYMNNILQGDVKPYVANGLKVGYWVPINPGEVDIAGNISPKLIDKIQRRAGEYNEEEINGLQEKHKKVDKILEA